jgi:hypothetical protein
MWCALPAAVVSLAFLGDGSDTPAGFSLAIASGAVTMGLGYIVWYLAVLHLTVGQRPTFSCRCRRSRRWEAWDCWVSRCPRGNEIRRCRPILALRAGSSCTPAFSYRE